MPSNEQEDDALGRLLTRRKESRAPRLCLADSQGGEFKEDCECMLGCSGRKRRIGEREGERPQNRLSQDELMCGRGSAASVATKQRRRKLLKRGREEERKGQGGAKVP